MEYTVVCVFVLSVIVVIIVIVIVVIIVIVIVIVVIVIVIIIVVLQHHVIPLCVTVMLPARSKTSPSVPAPSVVAVSTPSFCLYFLQNKS